MENLANQISRQQIMFEKAKSLTENNHLQILHMRDSAQYPLGVYFRFCTVLQCFTISFSRWVLHINVVLSFFFTFELRCFVFYKTNSTSSLRRNKQYNIFTNHFMTNSHDDNSFIYQL